MDTLDPSGPIVLTKLKTKKKWNSEELGRMLEEEIERKAFLVHKKEEADSELEKLKAEGIGDVKGELDQLHKSFNKVKTLIRRMIKSKIPNRLDYLHEFERMENAEELERASAYLTVVQFYQQTSERIEANLESDLETDAIQLFHRLRCIEVSYLRNSDCEALHRYGNSLVVFWEHRLIKKLTQEFEELLEIFGWPMRLKTVTPTLEHHEKFHRTILNLAKVSATLKETIGDPDGSLSEGYGTEAILPIQVLMGPLKRRFRFHFLSDKPTNESSRPEWYFSQIKQWIHDLVPFVKTHFENVTISEIGISSVVEFVRCITEMLVTKVEAHLHDDLRDSVFVKVLEESINYENEIGAFLVDNVDSPSDTFLPPFVDTIFSKSLFVKRWMEAERRASLEKLDDMFSSQSAWNKPVIAAPAEIVDLFIAVIRSLTDRFAHLRRRTHRLHFLHLLNDLLEEFHVRCLQTWKSRTGFEDFASKDILIDFIIADSLCCVQHTLQEWEYLSFFSSLSCAMTDEDLGDSEEVYLTGVENFSSSSFFYSDTKSTVGVFTNACELFRCLADEIQGKWCSKVVRRLKDELLPYVKLKWQNADILPNEAKRISEKLIKPIQSLKDLAKALCTCMDSKSVAKWMKRLAVKVDELIMEAVIFPNSFCHPAVEQLSFDLKIGIFPIFNEFGVNEKLFFGSCSSALTTLQLSTGEALLLYDTLMNGNFEAHEAALAELNISICQSEVIKILRNRCDLHV